MLLDLFNLQLLSQILERHKLSAQDSIIALGGIKTVRTLFEWENHKIELDDSDYGFDQNVSSAIIYSKTYCIANYCKSGKLKLRQMNQKYSRQNWNKCSRKTMCNTRTQKLQSLQTL